MTDRTLALLDATPGWAELASAAGLDRDTTVGILAQAARFAEDTLVPLGIRADREGCRRDGPRVITPAGYPGTYARMGADGWLAMDLPQGLGGQGLPLALHAAVTPAFEGAATAFMMAAGASRAAAHTLAALAPGLAAAWAPRLAEGRWTASICISEPEAGSDVGRIRTRAEPEGNHWRITGQKCWISFGAHDIGTRIGQMALARTAPPETGTRGLSLFLVPDRDEAGRPNGVTCTGIEDKMGLHGSPTCQLAFEGAAAHLVGEPGRGLPALFTMIRLMRLQCAAQGAGIARRATAIATAYAAERRQGGDPAQPPVTIDTHADIRRRLLDLDARTAVLEAFLLELAITLDRAAAGDPEATLLAPLVLPLAKNFAAETAYSVASDAILVLGGAGYTRDWPLEQLVRDARVIAVYEGTTGMQAQDFLHRNLLRDGGRGAEALCARIATELPPGPEAAPARDVLARFHALVAALVEDRTAPPDLAADGALRAGWVLVSAWMAARLLAVEPRLARFRLHQLGPEMAAAEAACHLPADLVATG